VVDYLDRLRTVEEQDPVLLIVYAYHFYMALLSGGGPILRRMATKALKLPEDGSGVEIFTMQGVDANQYRSLYDNLKLTEEEQVRGTVSTSCDEVLLMCCQGAEFQSLSLGISCTRGHARTQSEKLIYHVYKDISKLSLP
jgi:hypothetical protein